QGTANNDLGVRAFYQGRWLAARDYYEASRAAHERAGALWDAAMASANIAELLVYWGRVEEAEPLLEKAMRVWAAVGAQDELAVGREMLGQVALRTGRHDEALTLFAQAKELADERGGSASLRLHGLIAETHVRAGRAADALPMVDAALAQAASS